MASLFPQPSFMHFWTENLASAFAASASIIVSHCGFYSHFAGQSEDRRLGRPLYPGRSCTRFTSEGYGHDRDPSGSIYIRNQHRHKQPETATTMGGQVSKLTHRKQAKKPKVEERLSAAGAAAVARVERNQQAGLLPQGL